MCCSSKTAYFLNYVSSSSRLDWTHHHFLSTFCYKKKTCSNDSLITNVILNIYCNKVLNIVDLHVLCLMNASLCTIDTSCLKHALYPCCENQNSKPILNFKRWSIS